MHLLFIPVVALLSGLPSVDDDPGPRVRIRTWRAATTPLAHLQLTDGRRLYRTNNVMRFPYPGLLAANDDERRDGYAYALRIESAHRLLAPIRSSDAALELAQLFTGGTLITDRSAYDAIHAIASRAAPTLAGWAITLASGAPATYGARASRTADRFEVARLVFTSSDFGRMSVVEERYVIPVDGAIERTATTWIGGPPRTWQTSGEGDPDEATARYEAVRHFRRACLRALAVSRTIEPFARVLATNPTFGQLRAAVGDPADDFGSGIHIYYYPLGDGTAVIVGAGGDDHLLSYARHVEIIDPDADRPRVGRVLRKFDVGNR